MENIPTTTVIPSPAFSPRPDRGEAEGSHSTIPPHTQLKSSAGLTFFVSILFLMVGLVIGYAAAIYLPPVNILPQNTCTPRPACLDATPRCMIPETPDMCPPTPTSTITPEILETRLFKDIQNRYQIMIPGNWTQMETADFPNNQQFIASDGSAISINILDSDSESLSDFLTAQDKKDLTSWEGQSGRKVIFSEKTIVIGLPAVKRVEELLAADFTTLNTYLLVNKQVYSFMIIPVELPYDQTEAFQKYENVLNTFEPLSLAQNPL